MRGGRENDQKGEGERYGDADTDVTVVAMCRDRYTTPLRRRKGGDTREGSGKPYTREGSGKKRLGREADLRERCQQKFQGDTC